MSTLRIEETLAVDAPPSLVWAYLVDPTLIVGCLPGAQLTSSSEDGRTHEGTVKVKLGAMTVAYRGTATFVEVDPDRHSIRIEAKGRERTGAGQVSMTMNSRVSAAGSGAELVVEADVKLAGKIVTFGRGMIDVVTRQILKDFSSCLSRTLAGQTGSDETPAFTPPPPMDPEAANALLLLVRAVRTWLKEHLGRAKRQETDS